MTARVTSENQGAEEKARELRRWLKAFYLNMGAPVIPADAEADRYIAAALSDSRRKGMEEAARYVESQAHCACGPDTVHHYGYCSYEDTMQLAVEVRRLMDEGEGGKSGGGKDAI